MLQAHAGPVVSIAFSRDGRQLVTGSDDNTAVLWGVPDGWPHPVDLAHLRTWLCTALNAPISKDDWATYFSGLSYQSPCH